MLLKFRFIPDEAVGQLRGGERKTDEAVGNNISVQAALQVVTRGNDSCRNKLLGNGNRKRQQETGKARFGQYPKVERIEERLVFNKLRLRARVGVQRKNVGLPEKV